MSGQKKGKEAVLFPGERLDDLQLNGLELIQDPKKFCFGFCENKGGGAGS